MGTQNERSLIVRTLAEVNRLFFIQYATREKTLKVVKDYFNVVHAAKIALNDWKLWYDSISKGDDYKGKLYQQGLNVIEMIEKLPGHQGGYFEKVNLPPDEAEFNQQVGEDIRKDEPDLYRTFVRHVHPCHDGPCLIRRGFAPAIKAQEMYASVIKQQSAPAAEHRRAYREQGETQEHWDSVKHNFPPSPAREKPVEANGKWRAEGQWVYEPSGFSYHMETEQCALDIVNGANHPNSKGINRALDAASPSEDTKRLYYELLFEVENKYEGESRHETARRLIREAQSNCGTGDTAMSSQPQQIPLSAPTQDLHTAHEWNKILGTGILDWDGFRDGTITTTDRITRQDFERRAVHATRLLSPGSPSEHATGASTKSSVSGAGSEEKQ